MLSNLLSQTLKTQMFQASSRFSIVMLPASIEYSPPTGRIETPSTTVIARHTDGASGRENSLDARKGLDDPPDIPSRLIMARKEPVEQIGVNTARTFY